ncbi:MAG TPA: hypothetical protein VGV18_06620 [Verrucomicrobiae bacterium]|nr:hypothetical protein [Verrucomicrobiae bacterium]
MITGRVAKAGHAGVLQRWIHDSSAKSRHWADVHSIVHLVVSQPWGQNSGAGSLRRAAGHFTGALAASPP